MVFNSFAHNQNLQSLKKRNSIHNGTTKILMDDPQEDILVLHFKDTISKSKNNFFDQSANTSSSILTSEYTIPGKGVINNRLSELFFTRLTERRIDNHFISRINMKEQHIRSCIPLPFKIVIHNFSGEEFAKRMEVEKAHLLPEPVIEFYFKLRNGEYTLISERHIFAFNMATQEEIDDILLKCQRVNDFMTGQLLSVDFKLINFSLEFGRFPSYDYYMDTDILLIDEITPDTMCLLDLKTNEVFDRSSIIKKIEKGEDAYIYSETAKRFGLLKE